MDKFATSIREKYKERLINREEQWPPCHSDKLVRLELLEREKGEGYSANEQRDRGGKGRAMNTERDTERKDVKRTPLAYGDLFKVESGKKPVRKVLIEGDAGIGKTTLCISVSEDWASGKLFQQFELVLHIPLRMKVVASADSLPELLKLLHPSTSIRDSVASSLEEEEGKSVLIIADGWDELVILTSRPSASASLHRLSCIDRFVEVQGFSKENIKEYIESEFHSNRKKIASLSEQLEQNRLIESVCSVPLNCAIICHLCRTLEEAFPTTMTELYTKIILNLILCNIQKAGAHDNILSLPKFDALPADLQESWWLLCEFAFQALKNDHIVFSQEELAEFFPEYSALSEKIFCFGLLQLTESVFDIGRGISFHFLHLTIQEYLAALHLVKRLIDTRQSSKTDALILDPSIFELCDLQERFAIVCKFFFGIYFNVMGCNDPALIKPYLSHIWNKLLLCHCAFEARNTAIESDIIHSLKQSFSLCFFAQPRTAHDCTAVLYIIDRMQVCHDMELSFCNCHVGENQIRALTDSLASKDGRLQIKTLNLSGNKLACESLGDLLHRASSAFQSLTHLYLDRNIIKPQNIMIMLAKPSCKELSSLDLSGNNLGISGLQSLENAISAGCLASLKYLNLSDCLTDNADTHAAALVTFLESLSAHCPNLHKFDLSDNNLGAPGASALAVAISEHTNIPHNLWEPLWLKWITLNNTKLGDEGLCAFIGKLKSPYHFNNLSLQNNSIHATGIKCLAEWFDNAKGNIWKIYIGSLALGDNPLGIEGVISTGKILGSCEQSYVDLSYCHLTTVVENIGNPPSHDDQQSSVIFRHIGQQLCQMPKSDNITSLDLGGNCFTGERPSPFVSYLGVDPEFSFDSIFILPLYQIHKAVLNIL